MFSLSKTRLHHSEVLTALLHSKVIVQGLFYVKSNKENGVSSYKSDFMQSV